MRISNKQEVKILDNILTINDKEARDFLSEAFFRFIAKKQEREVVKRTLINEAVQIIAIMRHETVKGVRNRELIFMKEELKSFKKGKTTNDDFSLLISDYKEQYLVN